MTLSKRMKSEARTPNIRISRHSHEVLSEMAAQDNASMQAVLDKAIEHYRRERFLHAANADYAALKSNKKAWERELEERELWERTLADGLEKE
jgi:hypothetical protein